VGPVHLVIGTRGDRAYVDASIRETLTEPSWNVAPTDPVHAVLQADDERRLDVLRWGLVPWWSKHTPGAARIDECAETIATQPAYREPSETRRCLVVAGGYFGWRRFHERRKQPYFHPPRRQGPDAFAGLGAIWRHPDGSQRTCSIVTTQANETVAPLHDRMAVVLPPRAWGGWLDPGNHDTVTLSQLLVPAPPVLLTANPVSPAANSLRNNGPEAIVEATGHQLVGGHPVEHELGGNRRPAPWNAPAAYGDHTAVGLRSHLGAPLARAPLTGAATAGTTGTRTGSFSRTALDISGS
jgi:putative SOS response-associated peptidase YedK